MQERVEALTAGVANSGPKALALYAMQRGRDYTNGELNAAAETFLGQSLPFKSNGTLQQYCRWSLEPVGFAVEKKVVREHMYANRLLTAYSIIEEGEIYGKPSIERFMMLSHKLNLPLERINGATSTPGAVRRGYVVAKVLEALSDGEPTTASSLEIAINVSQIRTQLTGLHKSGLINYKSVQCDTYGGPERDCPTIELADREKLETYLTDDGRLRADTLKVRNGFDEWGYLRRTLALHAVELDRHSLHRLAAIPKDAGSRTIPTLVMLGVYRYTNFIRGNVKSDVQITDNGLLAYELAYKPVLLVANDPISDYVFMDYKMPLEVPILELFREELERFRTSNNKIRKKNPTIEVDSLLSHLETNGIETFRRKDLIEILKEGGDKRNLEGTVAFLMEKMRREGIIESIGVHGYYRLARTDNEQA